MGRAGNEQSGLSSKSMQHLGFIPSFARILNMSLGMSSICAIQNFWNFNFWNNRRHMLIVPSLTMYCPHSTTGGMLSRYSHVLCWGGFACSVDSCEQYRKCKNRKAPTADLADTALSLPWLMRETGRGEGLRHLDQCWQQGRTPPWVPQ